MNIFKSILKVLGKISDEIESFLTESDKEQCMTTFELKFYNLPIPPTLINTYDIPGIGDTLTQYLREETPEDFSEHLVIYGFNSETKVAMAGVRFVTIPEYPTLVIDMHLGTVRCSRCEQVNRFMFPPLAYESSYQLDQISVVNYVALVHRHHENCTWKVCLN